MKNPIRHPIVVSYVPFDDDFGIDMRMTMIIDDCQYYD